MGTNGGLLVEFVGLPASGKSRIAREVQESLTNGCVAADDNTHDITTSSGKRAVTSGLVAAGMVLTTSIRSPRATLAAARALATSDQNSTSKTLRLFLYHQFLRAELRRARRANELHLADQGFLQHLRRVHLTADREGMGYLRSLANTCYPELAPALVVFVDVDHRTRMERAIERGTDIDDALFDPDHPAIKADLESYRDIKALVPALGAELGIGIETLSIDNRDDNLAENVVHIVSAIEDVRDRITSSESIRRAPPNPEC